MLVHGHEYCQLMLRKEPNEFCIASVPDRGGPPAPSRKPMEANKQGIEELEEGISDIPQNQGN